MIDGSATCVQNKGQSVGCNHTVYSTYRGWMNDWRSMIDGVVDRLLCNRKLTLPIKLLRDNLEPNVLRVDGYFYKFLLVFIFGSFMTVFTIYYSF